MFDTRSGRSSIMSQHVAIHHRKKASTTAAPKNIPTCTVVLHTLPAASHFPSSDKPYQAMQEGYTSLKKRLNTSLTELGTTANIRIAHIRELFHESKNNKSNLANETSSCISEIEVQAILEDKSSQLIESKKEYPSIKSLITAISKDKKDSEPPIIIAIAQTFLEEKKFDELKSQCSNATFDRLNSIDDVVYFVEKTYRPFAKQRKKKIDFEKSIGFDNQALEINTEQTPVILTLEKINEKQVEQSLVAHAQNKKEEMFNYLKELVNKSTDEKQEKYQPEEYRQQALSYIKEILTEGTFANKIFRAHRSFLGLRRAFGWSLFKPASDCSGLLKEIHKLKTKLMKNQPNVAAEEKTPAQQKPSR